MNDCNWNDIFLSNSLYKHIVFSYSYSTVHIFSVTETARGYGGQWKLWASMVLIMRCTAPWRSCDICYQPSGRETRHLFIGLIPLPMPPPLLTLLFVCTVLELGVYVLTQMHIHSQIYGLMFTQSLCRKAQLNPAVEYLKVCFNSFYVVIFQLM